MDQAGDCQHKHDCDQPPQDRTRGRLSRGRQFGLWPVSFFHQERLLFNYGLRVWRCTAEAFGEQLRVAFGPCPQQLRLHYSTGWQHLQVGFRPLDETAAEREVQIDALSELFAAHAEKRNAGRIERQLTALDRAQID